MSKSSDAARYARYTELRLTVTMEVYNEAKCLVCGFQSPSNVFHHVEYAQNEEYARDGKSLSSREKRCREAADCPERFVLLCQKCHIGLGPIVARLLELSPSEREAMIDCIRFTVEGMEKGGANIS